MNKTNIEENYNVEGANPFLKNSWISAKGTTVVFNIGPSFLHMFVMNKNTGRTYNYLFDSNKSIDGEAKDKSNSNKLPVLESHCAQTSYEKLNGKRSSVIKFNFYKEKCVCDLCLSKSYLFFGSQTKDLFNQFLRVLNSKHCETWKNVWKKIIIEQIRIIFSSIKERIIFDQLVESANYCAKMMGTKTTEFQLLELKYSYLYFHMQFQMNVRHLNKNTKYSNTLIENLEQTIITPIKEEVDPVYIKKEPEWEEFIKEEPSFEEKKYRPFSPEVFLSSNSGIVLTKTTDFTKIKGWRSKLFSADVSKAEQQEVVVKKEESIELPSSLEEDSNKPYQLEPFNYDPSNSDKPNLNVNVSNSSFLNISENSFSNSLKVHLLFNDNDNEVEDNLKKSKPPINFKPYFIPLIHSCPFLEGTRMCTCKTFSLGMVLNIGKKRHLSREALENLIALGENDVVVSDRRATLAACAVSLLGQRNPVLKRIIVPAVSSKITCTFDTWEEQLAFDKIADVVSRIPDVNDIDNEIKPVVNEMVAYVERKMEPIYLGYDKRKRSKFGKSVMSKNKKSIRKTKLERELRKLNISFEDINCNPPTLGTDFECKNDFCKKGCVCKSLNFKIPLPLHCGKVSCQFECKCYNRCTYENNIKKVDQLLSSLLAEEDTSEDESNEVKCLRVRNLEVKANRKKKIPVRFGNDSIYSKTQNIPKEPCSLQEDRDYVPACPLIARKYIKKQILKRKMEFCSGFRKDSKTLDDVFIWCNIHEKYNCLCVSWISRMKENALIWKPDRALRYLRRIRMMEMKITTKCTREVSCFNPVHHCARTFGAALNYLVRNSSETFRNKRKCELQNGILSSTNSYVKMKFFMVTPKKEEKLSMTTELDDVAKGTSQIENIKGVYARERGKALDVCDHEPPILPEHIVIEPEDEEKIKDQNIPLSSDAEIVNLTDLIKSNQLNVIKRPIRISSSINNSAVQQSTPINNVAETSAKMCTSNMKNENFMEGQLECVSPCNDRKRKSSDDEIIITDSEQNQSSEANDVNNPTKKKKNSSGDEEIKEKPSFDYSLERGTLKLDKLVIKEKVYDEENLPKLALFCLTPQIGYLPIYEFNSEVLTVQDPLIPEIYHLFKDLERANIWLNKFFKNRIMFECIDTNLKWVIVKPGILKLKNSLPFNPFLLENPSITITKEGGIQKKLDENRGRIVNVAVNQLPLLGGTDQNKRKLQSIQVTKSIVNICDEEGNRKKIHLDTLPILRNRQVMNPRGQTLSVPASSVLRTVYSPAPSVYSHRLISNVVTTPTAGVSPSKTNLEQISVAALSSPKTDSSSRTTKPIIVTKPMLITINSHKKDSQNINSSTIRPNVRHVLLPAKAIKNASPTLQSTLLRLNNRMRAVTSPPIFLRTNKGSTITVKVPNRPTNVGSSSSLAKIPLTGSKLVAFDGRPVLLHEDKVIPISLKSSEKGEAKRNFN